MKSSVRPGRPRGEESRKAILDAALKLIEQRGYAGFAIEAVAKLAGVEKATTYKWWPSRAELAVESFSQEL